MMKVLQSSVVRAVMAFVVGALIIKYREDTVHWLTVVIGALFIVSGLISVVLNRRPTPLPLPHREGQGGGSAGGGSA